MQFFYAMLGVLSPLAALILGFLLPLWRGAHRDGFKGGMVVGSPITLLLGVMSGYLVAGLGEMWLETDLGVPLGLFVGTFLGTVAMNYLLGYCGAAVVALLRRKRRKG